MEQRPKQSPRWPVVVIVVAGLVYAASHAHGGDTRDADTNPSVSEAATPDATATPHARRLRFKNGETFAGTMVDGTDYAIVSTRVTKTIGENTEWDTATQAQGRFIILRVLVKNETNESRDVSVWLSKLVSDSGDSYETSSDGEYALEHTGDNEAGSLTTQVNPHLFRYVKVVYDVAPGGHHYTLQIPSAMTSSDPPGELAVSI